MAHSAVAVTLDEYLATSYRPDLEYIEGKLKEKPVVAPVHGRVQVLLASWFERHEEEWHVQTVVETRTQVSLTRVRLPDVIVLASGPLPPKALAAPPLLAIEVLSASDTYSEVKERAKDLAQMGVANIWLIDPAQRSVDRWDGDLWRPVSDEQLHIPGSPVYLDLGWIWRKLDKQARIQPD